MPPSYYLIDGIEGDTPEDALREKLGEVVKQVREVLCLGEEFPDRKIYDGLYLLREDGLVSARAST
ncbi:hypothetical protein ACFL3Q_15810 [Planctomycetota bacterium]